MKNNIPIHLAVEDDLSEAVLKKIIHYSAKSFSIGLCYGKTGKGYLEQLVCKLNTSPKSIPFIIITDLDRCKCAPTLYNKLIPNKINKNLLLRIAVREVEAWLFAHKNAFARYLCISNKFIPTDADCINDPKELLINIVKKSKNRTIKDSIIPRPNTTAKIGPDYNGPLIDFVNSYWDPNEAKHNSFSLNKTIIALNKFNPKL